MKYDDTMVARLNLKGLEIGRGLVSPKGTNKSETYNARHWWVRMVLGEPKQCAECGEKEKRIEYANIDHKYKKDISDYIPLCCHCHRLYDYNNHLSNKGSRWGSIPNKVEERLVYRGI